MTKNTFKEIKIDERGFYGEFGGAYVPEILHRNVEELQKCYLDILNDAEFQKEFRDSVSYTHLTLPTTPYV